MARYVVPIILLVLFAPLASAQPIPSGPALAPAPGPIIIPIPTVKPPYGYYKSGGVLVGADGYLPFDTGPYLLGGYEGLTRYSGSFVMVPPAPLSAPYGLEPGTVTESAATLYPTGAAPSHWRLFHRR
jgi:hypothetical protein